MMMATWKPAAGRVVALAVLTVLAGAWITSAQPPETDPSPFASPVIDIGTVVGDIAKSRKFYTEALGFKEVEGFDIPADFAKDTGLSDSLPFHVHVLVLGTGPQATKLKLIQFKTAPGARVDQSFVHSTYGFRYLTIAVKDVKASIANAAKAGVKPIAKGAVKLPEGFPAGWALVNFRDPDGNLIELVGPYAE